MSLKMSLRMRLKAQRRLDQLEAQYDLTKFVPLIEPDYVPPLHLLPYCRVWDRIQRGEEVRVLVIAPPRHTKTDTGLAGAARFLKYNPKKTVGYVACGDKLAKSKSAKARGFALRAGVRLSYDSKSKSEWRTTAGGGFLACGIGGSLIGMGLDVAIMDDPYARRKDADSAAVREEVRLLHSSGFVQRIEPGGSEIVTHTRWNGDDLIEELSGRGGYEVIHLPAVSGHDGKPCEFGDAGAKALWPDRWPLERLKKRRASLESDHDWHSLYQGDPRPRGEQLFGPANFYNLESLPTENYRMGIGLDFAYTAKQASDFCIAIKAIEHKGHVYIIDVHRKQQKITHYARELNAFRETDPTYAYRALERPDGTPVFQNLPFGCIPADWSDAVMVFHYGGTERGVVDLLGEEPHNLYIHAEQATRDKWIRAQPFVKLWNRKRVLVPNGAPWVKPFLKELSNFRGLGDEHDDQVDAVSSLVDNFKITIIDHVPLQLAELSRWGEEAGRGYG